MKTVQGTGRSYQLVQKTKRKDIDGVIYLVAGEKDLWVKLLKDKSSQKEMEVRSQITNGYGSFFDIPLDIVMDSSGFLGYTFKGQEMDVVPVKEENVTMSHKQVPKLVRDTSNNRASAFDNSYQLKKKDTSNTVNNRIITLLGLFMCGLLLFSLNYFWLNGNIWKKVGRYIGYNNAQGCVTFSLHGIVPGIVGIGIIINTMKQVVSRPVHVGKAVTMEIAIFFISVILADFFIALLVVVITAAVGTVQEYMSTIIMVIAVVFIVKGLLKK